MPIQLRFRTLLLSLLGLAFAHALLFVGYFVDDAYISFRYAHNLARGAGLVYNAGERIEGFTNLLWVLLIAAGEALGMPASMSVPWLGLAALAGLVIGALRLGRWLQPERRYAGVLAGAIVAASTGIAFYSVSGLETVLFSLWLLLATAALLRDRPVRFALLVSLAVLTRPEGALLAGLGAALFLLRATRAPELRRAVAQMVAVLAAVAVSYAAFKIAYFGSLLPNTFDAKRPDLRAGLEYGLGQLPPLLGLMAVAAYGALRDRRAALLAGLWGIHFCAVVLEGGDWFPAGRILAPYLAWLALAADLGVARMLAPQPGRAARVSACIAATALYLGFQVQGSHALSNAAGATLAVDEGRALLARSLAERGVTSVAAHDIGLVGYLMRSATIVDLGGLVDREIARGAGGYGQKRPSLEYLERRAPEVVLIATSQPSRSASGQMRAVPLFPVEEYVQQSAWFRSRYAHEASYALSSKYHLHVFGRTAPGQPAPPVSAR